MQLAMLANVQEQVRSLRLQLAQAHAALEASEEVASSLRYDLSKLQQWAVSESASELDTLPSPHKLPEILGVGYSPTERTRTLWNHFHRAFDAVTSITGGDHKKTAQLFAYASQRLSLTNSAATDKQRANQSAIVESLREFFTSARERTGDGRPPRKLAQCVQVVLAAVARAPELGGVSMAAVANELALGPQGVSKLSARCDAADAFIFDLAYDGLFDARSKVRSDAYSQEQIDWIVSECWLSDDFTRESEQKKHEVYDPHSRQKDRKHHRLRWLEYPLGEFYQRCKERAAAKAIQAGWEDFSPSKWTIAKHRPFWVKDATRDVCLCRYHLEFDLLAKGLTTLRRAIKCPNDCEACKNCPPLTTGLALRAALTCPRPDGASFDAVACVKGTCAACSDLRLLGKIMCPTRREAAKSHDLSWERYLKKHDGQDKATGEDRYKHDFFEQRGTGDELFQQIGACLKTFNPHHDLAKCQDLDWSYLKQYFPHRSFVSVQDFSENFHHVVRFEPQSKYYQQVDSTLYMVVVRYHLDDATRMPTAERDALRAAYEAVGLPPIIKETLAFVSADRQHDNAFVRHVNDKYVVPYMQSLGEFDTHYARSDGCKGQFKQAAHFDWVSRRKAETGVRTDWSFFCSCHGKCDCDPEGGAIKNTAAAFENHGAIDGMRVQAKLPDAAALTKWCNEGSPADSPHGWHAGMRYPQLPLLSRLKAGHSGALYRRTCFNVPTTGPMAISRTYAEVKLEGSACMHSFVDMGQPGVIRWRERSCHTKGCSNCFNGQASASGCLADSERYGPTEAVRLSYPAKPESSLSRVLKSMESKSVNDMLREAAVGEIVCISLPDRPHEPWMIGELQHAPLPATEADVAEAKALGFTVKVGASVLRLTKYEPFEFGSRKFIQTKVPLVVPSGRLRRHQLLSNEPRPRLTAKMKAESRFCDTTFELKEADLRAIVALVTSERGTIGDFKVDSILDHRIVVQRGKPVDQFKTKWAGWDRCEDLTWEPLAHFKASSQSAQKIIPQFGMHSNTKSAIGPDRLTRSSHFLSADWDTTLRVRLTLRVAMHSFLRKPLLLPLLLKLQRHRVLPQVQLNPQQKMQRWQWGASQVSKQPSNKQSWQPSSKHSWTGRKWLPSRLHSKRQLLLLLLALPTLLALLLVLLALPALPTQALPTQALPTLLALLLTLPLHQPLPTLQPTNQLKELRRLLCAMIRLAICSPWPNSLSVLL